jgi:hypothetical protein
MPGLDDVCYIDPHHLATARALLLNAGLVNRTIGAVGGRPITVFVDAQAMTRYGRKTAVTREAGRKRRLYGTLWGWTGTPKLCGQVAERQVAATLESLAGRALWLDQARGAGEVRAIRGIKVPGGPLDNAGSIAVDPARPNAGFVDFVVEVKNVRQTLYPEHREIYDLLWKAGHFPDHVPILIAPRIHHNTFLLFKAVGALGYPSTRQSFAGPPAIERDRFRHVMKELAIPHTQQLLERSRPSPPMARFFSKTVHTTSAASEGKTLLQRSAALWRQAAPILAQPEFQQLRKQIDRETRVELYHHLLEELDNSGLDVERLLPLEASDRDADADEFDWTEVIDPGDFIDDADDPG